MALGEKKVNFLGMDCVPRISRAQSMDALSSMASVAGYQRGGRGFSSVRPILHRSDRAGKVPPAKILVIGAGVAGLAAIGATRNMGAIVPF